MPLFDLPLDELYRYSGTNPRPDDHDEYWTRALTELDTHDPDLTITPVDHPATYARCADLWFTGVGGSRIHAKWLRPAEVGPEHPCVLQFHGYSAASRDWYGLLPYVAQGWSVAAMDVRGQGGLSADLTGANGATMFGHIVRGLRDDPQNLAYRNIFLDCVRLARIVMAHPGIDASRVGATGGSQGGGLALACAALEPRIRAVAAVFPFLCDFQRVWELDLAKDAYEELRTYLRRFDPTHAEVTTMWTKLGYIDVAHLAPRIRADVLMLTGLMDTVCPPSTQFAAFNRISSPKQVVVYPDFEHEDLPGEDDIILRFFADLFAR